MANRRKPLGKAPLKRPVITPAEARAYTRRWKLVNEYIDAERRAKTPQQRYDEVVDLMQWVDFFGSRKALEADERIRRDVWNRLRRLYRARS
jgi:hypothetical protein